MSSRISNIIQSLQQKIDFDEANNGDVDVKVGVDEFYPSNFLSHYWPDEHPDDDERDVDAFTYPPKAGNDSDTDRATYKTYRPYALPSKTMSKNDLKLTYKKKVSEQTKNEEDEDTGDQLPDIPEETNEKLPDVPKEETPTNFEEPNTSGEAGSIDNMDIGSDLGNIGMEEEPKTAGELGRIYELKKIYSRLTALETYLASETENELTEIRNQISKSIELFEIISSNFDSYKEKLDEIIVTYYKFIIKAYQEVRSFYKKHSISGD